MRFKSKDGLAGIDMVIAVVAITIFSALIISLMYYNATENIKVTKETLAMIYITEVFENIGIANYEDVTQDNISNLIPEAVYNSGYDIEISVVNPDIENVEEQDNIKKVKLTLTYEVGSKTYTCSMERLKVKE